MSKYVPIGTYVPEHEAQTLEATGANDNVLSRSLRGGVYGAGSQLLSTGGAVADAVGAEDVGGYLHKQSKGLRDTAALPGNSPRVGSYAQLRDDFSMSNLGEYAGGLVGGSLPITAAGIAGGLATGGAGFVPAMLGAGAATLPFNTGEVVQRQQADPQAMQQGAGARLLDAGIGGASASAVESLVPGLVGRQLMGKGAANLAKESFKQMAGRNAMDIPLEGLTEGTGTAIKQYAANQDKPLDWNEIKEGAIGGAAAGTVFTGLGTAADAAHSIRPKTGEMLNGARTSIRTRLDAARGKAGEKLEAAGNTAPGKKVKGVFDDVSEMVDRGKKKVNDTLDKISRGEELGSPADWLAATTDEAKRRMAEFSDSERVKAVVSAGKEMMDDAGFDAAKRADLADALKNTGDRGSQMAVAAMKKAWDLSKAGAGKIKEFADAVNSEFKAYDRRDVDVESRVVDEPTSTSELTRLGHTPADVKAAPAEPAAPTTEPAKMTIKEFSAARKAFIAKAMQDDADLSPEAAREMFNLSQNDGRVGMPKSPEPPKRSEDYSGVHKVIADAIKNNGVVERRPDLFDSDEKIGSVASTLRTLIEKMAKGNVSKGLMNKVSRLFGDDAASILNTVKNTISADLNPGEAEQFFRNMSVMKDIERGERSLHDVMRDSMTDEARTRTQEIEKDADVLKAHARGQLGGSRSEAALSDQMINEYYERNYGENADRVRAAIEQAVKPARGREEGAARMDENGAEVQDSEGGFDDQGRRLEAADKDTQVYGLTKPNVEGKSKSKLDGMAMHKDSQYAKQHMFDLRAKFSGVDTNGDYTHEVRFEQLPGSEFGHVVVEKYDNSKEFNESDLKNMELESHEFSKSNSRIEVGGRILDAVKIARTMRGKLQGQFESGPTTAKGRLASGFKHGLSMLTDQFDQRIDVADDVVIGFVSGKKLTWGEAQKLDKRTHADKMNDADAAELFELRKEFQAAKDAGASPEVIQEILDAYKELEGEIRAAKNKELGQGEDLQGRSTSRQRPMSVIEARDAVEKGKNPSSPARTREDDSVPKQIAVEYDPEDENRFMVIRDNPNGVSKDNDGSFAKDKDGNIHALGDKTGPAFGGNETNRVARAPRGSVVRQDAAQPLVNARMLAKKNEDLTTNDAIVHRSNMDGSGHFVSPSRVPHKNLIAAIAEWDSKASVGAAKLKQRAETLLANFDMMSAADQRKFMTIAPENVKAGRGLPAVDYGSMVDYPEARAEGAVKGRFAPMSMVDAREIVNDLAVKYKDQILPPDPRIVGPIKPVRPLTTKQVTSHQRNPVQFYNEGIAGVRGPETKPATQPAAQPKPSINEKLVDKVVLSENYPTTVAGAEKFLNAAKKRFEALKAEDQRVLNDDDHPTQRLPEAEQKVLNALHQTFDKNSDLAPFFTELDGWDAVPEAEQIRLMKFAESLTEGKPDPKPVAAKKAAFLERAASGDKALIGELKTSTDAKGLQRALELLNDHEFEGVSESSTTADNVADVYDVLNTRLGELVGGSEDVAYGLQTTRYSLESTQGESNESSDRASKQSPTAHGFTRAIRKHEGAFEDGFRRDGIGVREEETSAIRPDVGSFGDTKNCYAYVNESADGTIYSTLVSHEMIPTLQKEIARLVANGATENDFLQAVEAHALQQAYYDPADGTVGTIGPSYGTPAFEFHNARGHLRDTGQYWKGQEGVSEGRIYQVKNTSRDQIAKLFATVTAFHKAMGKEGAAPKWVRESGAKPGKEGQASFSAQSTNSNKSAGPRRRLSVEQHIEKVLGKSVRVLWSGLSHAGQYTHAYGKGLIELSVHALNPMSTAYHESLHAFFAQLRDAGAVDITNILNKAASSEHVIAQLRERFKNEPAVLRQLKDPEERAAYMYQMWASDPTFKVSIAAKNVFQKIADVIRKALGIWSNDERALHIMEFFHSGDYAKSMSQPNAMRAMIMEPGRNRAVEVAKTLTEPMRQLADAIASSGDARLRDTEIPALVNLADRIKRRDTAEGGDQGFIPAARIATTKRLGDMAAQLEGYSPETLNEALNSLQSGILAPSADAQRAVAAIKAILARTKAYMESAGVELGDLGPDYFPRVWDPHYISKNEQAMLDMLQPYVRSGQFKGNPTEFIRRLTSRDGNEFGVESTKPGMQHAKVRDLAFLKAEDVAPFLNKDLMGTLASYISQAARRAEWERRLGGDKLEALKLAAQGEGATPAQMAMVDDYLKGVDGTLGDQIDPNARRLMGNMIVYQNVRLLPMAMFSMLVDPMGVMVRGGTVTDAWTTFKRGIKSIPVTYGKTDVHDEATKIAELVGVVDNAMLTSVMGDLYTQGMVGGTAKKINNAFFKYNMVEGLNRAFRVGATEAAMKFMERHMNGPQTPNSARWIAELGLRPGDIKMVGGRMALLQSDGLSPRQVTRVHAAINQWVDGSMLRPDAADKPIWMNDPHYALISHLKQFVFTFQKVILGRLVHELRHGNYAPVMALAAYVPIMIAADTAKGVIQGGGDEPEWKKGWGVEEYVGHGIQRAGLFGVGQFGVDALEDAQRGGSGFGALSGPTLEQLADMMQVMGGSKQFESVALRAMPANAVYANWSAEGAPAANLTQ